MRDERGEHVVKIVAGNAQYRCPPESYGVGWSEVRTRVCRIDVSNIGWGGGVDATAFAVLKLVSVLETEDLCVTS
jgi:hypothetical protein